MRKVDKAVDVAGHFAEDADPLALDTGLLTHVRTLGRLPQQLFVDFGGRLEVPDGAAHRARRTLKHPALLLPPGQASGAATMTVDADDRLA